MDVENVGKDDAETTIYHWIGSIYGWVGIRAGVWIAGTSNDSGVQLSSHPPFPGLPLRIVGPTQPREVESKVRRVALVR